MFGVGDDEGVFAVAWVTMNEEAVALHVDNPIFDDAGAGIEAGFAERSKRTYATSALLV